MVPLALPPANNERALVRLPAKRRKSGICSVRNTLLLSWFVLYMSITDLVAVTGLGLCGN